MSVARVTIHGRLAGQLTNNVLHFWKSGATSPGTLTDLLQRVTDWWVNNPWRLNASAAQTWHKTRGFFPEGTSEPLEVNYLATGAWDTSIDYTPVQAAVMQFKTGVAGRHGRGRTYMGGFGSRQMQDGLWSTATMVQLNAVAQALEDFWTDDTDPNYKGNGWFLVVCPRNAPASFLRVTDVVARPMVGNTRTRQLGVGA